MSLPGLDNPQFAALSRRWAQAVDDEVERENRQRRLSRYEAMVADDWAPQYSPWRHGGWYVDNVCYPSGAVGCVSRNYPDKKWRVVCAGQDETTYANRDAAAYAERDLALDEWNAAVAP